VSVESLSLLISAVDEASKPIQQVADSIERFQKVGDGLKEVGGNITDLGESMSARVTAPIVGLMTGAAAAAISFESAMADVNKVMDFTSDESSEMATGIMRLSRTLPVSAQGLAEIAAAGGQLGTAKEDLLEFTELTAQMAIAFDMTAGLAGESIGELKNVYGLTLDETELLGDAINQLSNNAAANASDIVNAAGRIGGTAQQFGLAEEETAALATTLIAFGAAPEVASTAINGMLPMLQTATGQSSRFQDALQEIGLSAEELEQAIATDAMGGLQMFVDALSDLSGSQRANIIQDMFGAGSDAQLLGTLAQNADQLQRNLGLVGDQSAYAGSMLGEFESRSSTTENQLQLTKNALGEIAATIGEVLLPAINRTLDAVIPLAHRFADFAAANPGIVQTAAAIALVAAAIGPLLIVVGQVVTAVGTLAKAWATVQKAVMAVSFVVSGIGVGPLLAIVFIGAAIAAIALLIANNWETVKTVLAAVGMAIYNAFEPVLPIFQQLGDAMQQMFMALWQMVQTVAQAAGQLLGFNLNLQSTGDALSMFGQFLMMVIEGFARFVAGIAGAIAQVLRLGAIAVTAAAQMVAGFANGASQVISSIRNMASQVLSSIRNIAGQAFSAGRNIVARVAEGIRAGVGMVRDAAASVASAIASFMPGSPVQAGPLTSLNHIASNPGAKIADMVAAGLQSNIPTVNAAMEGLSPSAIAPSTGGGVTIGSLSLSIPLSISGVSGDSQEFRQALEQHRQEIIQIVRDLQHNEIRTAY
jgi:TP901 family phage tail tape measure protein